MGRIYRTDLGTLLLYIRPISLRQLGEGGGGYYKGLDPFSGFWQCGHQYA